MGLVAEDGTGVAGANSYVTMEYASTYHADRGNDDWSAASSSPDTQREGALVRATAWIDATYGRRFPGTKVGARSQTLQWPRYDATDTDGNDISADEVPTEVMQATCEAALRELLSPGSLAPDTNPSERVVMEQVDVLKVQYSDVVAAADQRPVFSIIDGILEPLIGEPESEAVLYWGLASRA